MVGAQDADAAPARGSGGGPGAGARYSALIRSQLDDSDDSLDSGREDDHSSGDDMDMEDDEEEEEGEGGGGSREERDLQRAIALSRAIYEVRGAGGNVVTVVLIVATRELRHITPFCRIGCCAGKTRR